MEAAVQDGLSLLPSECRSPPYAARPCCSPRPPRPPPYCFERRGCPVWRRSGSRSGTAVQPMLAACAPDPGAAMARAVCPCWSTSSWTGSGSRCTASGDGGPNLHPVPGRHHGPAARGGGRPSALAGAESGAGRGGALPREDGRPESFRWSPPGRSAASSRRPPPRPEPLQVFFFDLLHVDGRDLLDAPLKARLASMKQLLPAGALWRASDLSQPRSEVGAGFAEAVRRRLRGSRGQAPVSPIRGRSAGTSWMKIKPRHTFDLMVTAVEWGRGRRQGWLSNLHLAAREAESGELSCSARPSRG